MGVKETQEANLGLEGKLKMAILPSGKRREGSSGHNSATRTNCKGKKTRNATESGQPVPKNRQRGRQRDECFQQEQKGNCPTRRFPEMLHSLCELRIKKKE